MLPGDRLQLDLVLDRHVVAEEEDVEPALQRLERLGRRVGPGRRHEGEVERSEFGLGFGDRPGIGARRLARAVRARSGDACRRELECLRRRRRASSVATATTRSFGPAAAAASDRSPAAREDLPIGRRRHDQAGPFDAVAALEVGRDLHELHRIAVAVREDPGVDLGHQATRRRAARAATSSPHRTPTMQSVPDVAPHATARSIAPGTAASSSRAARRAGRGGARRTRPAAAWRRRVAATRRGPLRRRRPVRHRGNRPSVVRGRAAPPRSRQGHRRRTG